MDYSGNTNERVSRDGIVLSPPRMIRRLQDYTDYTDHNANLSSSEGLADSVGGLHQRREDHSGRIYTSNLAHIHDRYGRPLNEPIESAESSDQYNSHNELHIDIDDNLNPEDEDANAVYERRSRSTMLLTSSFKNICPSDSETREQVERCTSTEVTSTKPDESLSVNSNQDSATTSPASETSEDRRASGGDLVENGRESAGISPGDFDNNDEPLNMSSTSSRVLSPNQYESSTTNNTRSARNDAPALPDVSDAESKPTTDLIQMNPDSNMNYQAQASAASLLQAPFPLAQNLAYPYINMSLPLLQYNLPQTLMALAPPVSSTSALPPSTNSSTADGHNSNTLSRDQQQSARKSSTPEGQQSQGQAIVNGSDSWDRAVPCRECGKMLKSERMLDLHMNTAHTHKTGQFYSNSFYSWLLYHIVPNSRAPYGLRKAKTDKNDQNCLKILNNCLVFNPKQTL